MLNPSNGELEDRVSPNDRPNRATLGAALELPFGRNHRYGSNWSAIPEALFGGWIVSASYQYQSGFPLEWTTSIYYDPARDPKDLKSNIGGSCPGGGKAGLDCPAWDISGFYIPGGTGRTDPNIVLGSNNVRYFPSTLPNVRTSSLNLLDLGISKTFDFSRGMTPTEVVTAWRAGADAVKIFPANAVGGATYLKSLKAPLPQIELIPTGGVSLDNIGDFIRAGALAVGVGADLVDIAAVRRGDTASITAKAQKYVAAVVAARATSSRA